MDKAVLATTCAASLVAPSALRRSGAGDDDAAVAALDRAAYGSVETVALEPRMTHSPALLARLLVALRPAGSLKLVETLAPGARTADGLARDLKLAGFADVAVTTRALTAAEREALAGVEGVDGLLVAEAAAVKPDFEVGAAAKLSLRRPAAAAAPAPVGKRAVWVISATEDDDQELLDDSDILLAEDLAKPVGAVAADCGTTNAVGKKKACKGCTCGLADEEGVEVDDEAAATPAPAAIKAKPAAATPAPAAIKAKPAAATSSCGSCYLGDAFRCATCPHLGTPAFKPGETVQLLVSDDL